LPILTGRDPEHSPLWDAPNTLITPHITPQVPDRTARSLEIICENVRRFRAGEAMLNRLTPEDMYTAPPTMRE
jgi:phosphoglycerate dehydrogenase-like enzyme